MKIKLLHQNTLGVLLTVSPYSKSICALRLCTFKGTVRVFDIYVSMFSITEQKIYINFC